MCLEFGARGENAMEFLGAIRRAGARIVRPNADLRLERPLIRNLGGWRQNRFDGAGGYRRREGPDGYHEMDLWPAFASHQGDRNVLATPCEHKTPIEAFGGSRRAGGKNVETTLEFRDCGAWRDVSEKVAPDHFVRFESRERTLRAIVAQNFSVACEGDDATRIAIEFVARKIERCHVELPGAHGVGIFALAHRLVRLRVRQMRSPCASVCRITGRRTSLATIDIEWGASAKASILPGCIGHSESKPRETYRDFTRADIRRRSMLAPPGAAVHVESQDDSRAAG